MVLPFLELQLTLTFLLCILNQIFYSRSRWEKNIGVSTLKKFETGEIFTQREQVFFEVFVRWHLKLTGPYWLHAMAFRTQQNHLCEL